ncbi:hypothetical protein C8K36_106255 [Rhodococcus sp. OK519]|nr:hypothetical protein C8K36_106255 [Rhodococcus sp. OK519]
MWDRCPAYRDGRGELFGNSADTVSRCITKVPVTPVGGDENTDRHSRSRAFGHLLEAAGATAGRTEA